jgi:hypothetical protein
MCSAPQARSPFLSERTGARAAFDDQRAECDPLLCAHLLTAATGLQAATCFQAGCSRCSLRASPNGPERTAFKPSSWSCYVGCGFTKREENAQRNVLSPTRSPGRGRGEAPLESCEPLRLQRTRDGTRRRGQLKTRRPSSTAWFGRRWLMRLLRRRRRRSLATTRCWPCNLNSVCLGSRRLPRPEARSTDFGLSAGILAAGPGHTSYAVWGVRLVRASSRPSTTCGSLSSGWPSGESTPFRQSERASRLERIESKTIRV